MAITVTASGTIGPWYYDEKGVIQEEYTDEDGVDKIRNRVRVVRRREAYRFNGFSSDEGTASNSFAWEADDECGYTNSGTTVIGGPLTMKLTDHSCRQISDNGVTWEEVQVWNEDPIEWVTVG